jgi:hypothetical protein
VSLVGAAGAAGSVITGGTAAGGGTGAGDGAGAGAGATEGAGLCLRTCAAALGRGVLGSGFFAVARAAGVDGAGGIFSGKAVGARPAAGVTERGTGTGRRKAMDTVLSCGVASTATVCSVTNNSCPPTSTRARTA